MVCNGKNINKERKKLEGSKWEIEKLRLDRYSKSEGEISTKVFKEREKNFRERGCVASECKK